MTRSRQLVTVSHEAGHIISYKDSLCVDTSLAECTLKTTNLDNGSVALPNLTLGNFVHFTSMLKSSTPHLSITIEEENIYVSVGIFISKCHVLHVINVK